MSDYSALDRLLHSLALSSPSLCETQFDVECAIEKPETHKLGQHVFIAGLARSGTTTLLRSIYQTGQFGTLTYRDMPFVLAPNSWARVHRFFKRNLVLKDRAHADGVLVSADSPEAFEDVFWRTFSGRDYIKEDDLQLTPHEVDDETLSKFRQFVGLVLKRSQSARYLSKNNNNILRVGSVLKAFPNAVVLIPFRHPWAQAGSLLRQHLRFNAREDQFIRKYMKWLVHREFGPDHMSFAFPKVSVEGLNPSDMDYWLELWMGVYQSLFSAYADYENVSFVCYETLTSQGSAWLSLCETLGLPKTAASGFENRHPDFDGSQTDSFTDFYHQMREAL